MSAQRKNVSTLTVTCQNVPGAPLVVSFPDPAPLRGKEGLGTLVDFLGILCVSNHVTHAYAHAHFSNKRVIRELRIVSCPGGGVWVAVTREFERDNCVISEILQSDWTIPNRAGVPRISRFSWHFVRFKSCDACLCACAFQTRQPSCRTPRRSISSDKGVLISLPLVVCLSYLSS